MDLEQIKQYNRDKAKKWYAEKRKKQLEDRAKYNEEHKEDILKLKQEKELAQQELNKVRCKTYCETHKEDVKAMKKTHYENNKDKILEQQKEMMTCNVCGCQTNKHKLVRHQRSNKCKTQAITPTSGAVNNEYIS